MRIRLLLVPLAVVLAATIACPQQSHAQAADVIRGRVVGPDTLPLAGVTVTATSLDGNVTRTARTDRSGRYTITFANGEGDYIMNFTMLGFAPRRFEVRRVADEEILIADARLEHAAAKLDAVNVRADRQRVNRNTTGQPDIGGTERPIDATALPAADLGDLAAMAASLPGVLPVSGEEGGASGFSVLGLGADQNSTTLNGMSFGGASLPRDAQVSSSLTTSPYDVSRGGFSGAQFSLRTRPGSNFINRGLSMLVDAPQLQWTDRAARALGQQYSNLSLSGNLSGPIQLDKAFYNFAYQLGRRASDLQSLLNTNDEGLRAAGVAPDSVARLLGILAQHGIPASAGGVGSSRLMDQGLVFGTIDLSPPTSTSGQSLNVTVNGGWNRQTPTGLLTTELPAHGAARTSWNASAQARHTGYFGPVLSETSVGGARSRSAASPFLELASGQVLVDSRFDDGSSTLRTLSFGGNQNASASTSAFSTGFTNQLSWFSANNRHRLKLTSELRYERTALEQAANLLGTFTFNSLEDLQQGVPATFSRQLSAHRRSIGQLVAGMSLGDAFRVTPRLQIQYGLRVDANRYLDTPEANPAIEQAFGRRNDVVPDAVFVSPRIGFSWSYGEAAQIGAFEGAMRGPRAVVRGGIGLFQNSPATALIGRALDNTGLPGAVQQIACIGPAAPAPDWGAYASDPALVPDRCADGSTGSVFASTAPNVALFAPDYAPQRSLRSNLSWSGAILGNRLNLSADVTYSRNMNQPGLVDLNFRPDAGFALAAEGGRPVYVQPTSIVPATGAIAARGSRVTPAYNRVSELRSDLVSESRQLGIGISPTRYSSRFTWRLNYTLSDVREQYRGFTSTVGNPFEVEWGRGTFNARHQLNYSLGYNFLDAVRVNWNGAFRSGLPYTPMVVGDVNGDGYPNDRAYVFDPAADDVDPAVAAGLERLLATGSASARDCLARQLGTLAGRNSCAGPWTSNASLSVSFNPLKLRLPQRANLSFSISNPLGAADLLLHGENDLRGWGQSLMPDASLLYVRGFDPATNRYRYEVNQRFGSTNPAQSAFRAPVTLTAMLRFDIGPTRERQTLTQQLDRGRKSPGQKLPEGMLRTMYANGGIGNPLATILREQDTLKLTPVQADSIASMNRRYMVRLDSLWSPVAKYLGALPERYDEDEAYARYREARRATVDMLARLAPAVKALLTDEQRRRLPPYVASLLDPRYLASIRSGTAGMGGGAVMLGGGGMMGGMPATSGNVERVIIRQ